MVKVNRRAVCVDVYYILYNIITTAHTRMIHHHCDMYFQRYIESTDSDNVHHTFFLRVLGLLGLLLGLLVVCCLSAL